MKGKYVFKKLISSREVSLVLVLIVLVVVVTIFSPSFLEFGNILDLLKSNVLTMVMALGMLCVLLVGGIDISIASTLALSGMSVGLMVKSGFVNSIPFIGEYPATRIIFGFVIGILIGAACGAVVGVCVGYGKIAPIIATMGGMYIFRALAYIFANNTWASAEVLGEFQEFGLAKFLGVHYTIWITLLIYIIFFVVLKWTKFGRNIYAVGSNPEAATISGISVSKTKMFVYIIMGVLAGLSGILAICIYPGAQPGMQTGREMDVIAACVIGGVSMSGGRGSVPGALLGALVLAVIGKALPLVGIPAIAQNTFKGVLIVAVIIINVLTQRAMKKRSLEEREI